jgi:hypothetical protein
LVKIHLPNKQPADFRSAAADCLRAESVVNRISAGAEIVRNKPLMLRRPASRRVCKRFCAAAALLILAWPAPSQGQGPGAAANFSLPDVNPNSASFQSQVSPRDYLQQVSGWYFGHAT